MKKSKNPSPEEINTLADELLKDQLEPFNRNMAERTARDLLTGRLDADPATGMPQYKSQER